MAACDRRQGFVVVEAMQVPTVERMTSSEKDMEDHAQRPQIRLSLRAHRGSPQGP